ncbi:7748_t:CDS:1, partial [Paraglomus occultum]
FDRHEDEINDRLNPDPKPTQTKSTPPQPQFTTVESKYADEACGVFSSLCALKREPECLSDDKINSCSNSLGHNQLE